MMTEAQALNALARQDPEAADEAKAALSWLTNGAGLETVSQLKLQEFVWYALPVKWPMTTGELIAVTRALGRLFSMLGMERYADVCMCPGTEKILTAYGDGHETGIAAYAEAVENSSTAPSDTGLLAWGSVMGPDERAAYDACAAAVELSIASGELATGSRGWRARRSALIDRWLTALPPARDGQTGWNDPARGHPPAGHPAREGRSQPGRHRAGAHHAPGVGGTWLARIHTERMDAWANSRPGERSRLAAAVLPRLLEETGAPDGALPTLGWLLGHADAGLRLTARYYIPPALVTEAVDMFGWREQMAGALRQELDVFPLHTLRGLAQGEMAAIRRSGTSLLLTRTGRLMTEDREASWRIGTAALIGADDSMRPDFAVAVREASLLFLLVSGPAGYEELTRHLTRIHTEEGWASHGGLSDAVRREIHGLRHRLWALHLLYTGRASREPLTLTETGVQAALAALRSRARGPRHHVGLGLPVQDWVPLRSSGYPG